MQTTSPQVMVIMNKEALFISNWVLLFQAFNLGKLERKCMKASLKNGKDMEKVTFLVILKLQRILIISIS